MKLPICASCAETNSLCGGCQSLLGEKKLSLLDVKVSRAVAKLAKQFPLDSVHFIRSIETPRMILLLIESDVKALVGRGGRISTLLSKELGKHVRIVRFNEADPKKTFEEIIVPLKILGVNEVFAQGGKSLKIRLPRSQLARTPLDTPSLTALAEQLFGKKVRLAFE